MLGETLYGVEQAHQLVGIECNAHRLNGSISSTGTEG